MSTPVSGPITKNTTWTAGQSPYEVTGTVNVQRGVTLAIEAGVEVAFDEGASLESAGALQAAGTAEAPIRFTGTSKKPGWWGGLAVTGRSGGLNTRSQLAHVVVEYAGAGNRPGLYLEYATVAVSDAVVSGCGGDAVRGGQLGTADLSQCSFVNNRGYAVLFTDGSVSPTLQDVTGQGNDTDAIGWGYGTLTGGHVWPALALPYVVTGNLDVAAGASLLIQPGVQIAFTEGTGLSSSGALQAAGTAEVPIRFTGTGQEPGWWQGLDIGGRSGLTNTDCIFDHVVVEYASAGNRAALALAYARVPVSHTRISDCGGDAVRGGQLGTADLSQCSFVNNRGYAVLFTDGSVSPTLQDVTGQGNDTDAIGWGYGTLTGGHVWPALALPYVVTGNLDVAAGASLLIQPGVQIAFTEGMGLSSSGALQAAGTAEAPIRFTGTSKKPGWWGGLAVTGRSGGLNTRSQLAHVVVEYAGAGNRPGLYLEYATVAVSDAVVSGCGGNAVRGGQLGTADLSQCSFVNNRGYAVLFTDGSVSPTLQDVTGQGNDTDAIGWGYGTLTGGHVWPALALPYVVTGNLDVAAGASLLIQPGVQIAFTEGTGLSSSGALQAAGTAEVPIRFTGTGQEPGWWQGLDIGGRSGLTNTDCIFNHVVVEYAGAGNRAALALAYARVPVSHTRISDCGGNAVRGGQLGTADLSQCSFVNNRGYAVLFTDGSVSPTLQDVTGQGNDTDAIGWGYGTLTGGHVWPALALPYVVTGNLDVAAGASLLIQPGVQIAFTEGMGLSSSGSLRAPGTAEAPIRFTGTSKKPGWWQGLDIGGRSTRDLSDCTLDHVVIEYAGNGNHAACSLRYAQLHLTHSAVARNSGDGVAATTGAAAGTAIEACQLVANAGYAVRNSDQTAGAFLVASSNWWGDVSGPTTDDDCNPQGRGSRITSRVAFRPFLTSADAESGPVAPSEARIISMTPRRWFAPADGTSRIWFDLTLRDGNGAALPGRTLRLATTLGSVVDGGITDAEGHTLAYMTSSQVGESDVFATLDALEACEFARSPSATVKFTSSTAADALFGAAAAPYLVDGIEIEPLPITRGVPTTLRARLNNLNDVPIDVDVSFGIAQLGIGLTFGPIGAVDGLPLPPQGEGVAEVSWTPPISGHFCLEVLYAITARPGKPAAPRAGGAGSGRAQRNVQSMPGPLGPPPEKQRLRTVQRLSSKAVGAAFVGVPGGGMIRGGIGKYVGFSGPREMFRFLLDWLYDTYIRATQALGGDPPRLDYEVVAKVESLTFTPLEPADDLPAARAGAFNDLMKASLDLTARLRAAVLSLDRYAGASIANDMTWASLQASALMEYKRQAGTAMVALSDRIQALLDELHAEGLTDSVVEVQDVEAYQQRLGAEGFNEQELAAARALGLTDEEIEGSRQARIAVEPAPGSLMEGLAALGEALRDLGANLMPSGTRSLPAPATNLAAGDAGGLARLYQAVIDFVVGNPADHAVTMQLRVRRLDLPPDWIVTVEPPQVQLDPGESIPAAVRVEAGLAAVQGTQPRVAVEGYVDEALVSGLVLDVVVPRSVALP